MADKKDFKSAPPPSMSVFETVIVVLLLVGVGTGIVNWVINYHGAWIIFFNNLPFYLINIFAKYVVFAFFISIVLFVLVIVYARKQNKIRDKIMSKVLPPEGDVKTDVESPMLENPKWKLVEAHINSDDESKWKLAILEADIILSELLESLHLNGEGVGEKLKSVEQGDFDRIDEAWEAHKIRNAIAHEGSDFLLTQREAKRVIRLYKSVFDEFKII